MIDLDGGVDRTAARGNGPDPGGEQSDRHGPGHPNPVGHAQRPKPAEHDQHQRHRQRGEGTPSQCIDESLHAQPPACSANLFDEFFHSIAASQRRQYNNIITAIPANMATFHHSAICYHGG
jgi:hypothetical protein